MPRDTNINLYPAQIELWTRAAESARGLIIRPKQGGPGTKPWATNLRHMLHKARQGHRTQAKQLYEQGDPRWGKSSFDSLMVQVGEDEKGWYVQIQYRTDLDGLEVEEL